MYYTSLWLIFGSTGHGEITIIFGPSKGEKVVILSLLELADIMTS